MSETVDVDDFAVGTAVIIGTVLRKNIHDRRNILADLINAP
jgi:hypothetical protein